MDKFVLSEKIKKSKPIDKNTFIQEKCRLKDVLDLGCIRHDAWFALNDPNWLHKHIKRVARTIIGIDYSLGQVNKLKDSGYNIIFGDVTKKLDIYDKFDVIVVGDLIEHLVNFEGFFDNCKRLLRPGAILIITTPNPFYIEGIHYLIFKKLFTVNPEHTSWVDPLCLAQLSERFGFEIEEIHYIKNSWGIKDIIYESKIHSYDILNDRWTNDSYLFKFFRVLINKIFIIFYLPYKLFSFGNSALVRYSDYLAVLKQK